VPITRADMPNLRFVPGVVELARELERVLGESYADLVRSIVKSWEEVGPSLTPTEARHIVARALRAWPELTAAAYHEVIDRLFEFGFMVGILDTGITVRPDEGDRMAVQWLKANPQGFIPALRNFSEDERRLFERVIAESYAGVDEEGRRRPFDLDYMVRRVRDRSDEARYKVERVVRTETAKVTSLGRIAAWGDDPERDWYNYHWVATHDDRTKDVSLLFEREGPYSYDQIRHRWTVDHNRPIFVVNRHTLRGEYQTSAFNCRCTVARTPKSEEELFAEGLVSRAEYEAMSGPRPSGYVGVIP